MSDTNDGTAATDAPVKSPSKQSDEDIIAEAKTRRKMCVDAESDNRVEALDDLAFLVGGRNQWNPISFDDRTRVGRPVITVNVLPTYLHQVTNDIRQNTPSIKVHPVDDNTDIETAKVVQGKIRHIEYSSNADVAYDRAANSAAAMGWGYFRFITEYATEDGFDQDIKFQSFRNHLAVRMDPFCTEPDGDGMQFAFVESVLSREEFKREYPKANANDAALCSDSFNVGWLTTDSVLITEYYRIEKEKVTVCLLSDGSSGFKDKLNQGAMQAAGISITKEREGERSKLLWFKLTAADVLDRAELMFKDPDGRAEIPIFPVYGDEIDIEGKVTRAGLVRNAKGPSQSYNVAITAATEELASRSKNPWVGAAGAFEGHEADYEASNLVQLAFLEYNMKSMDGKLAPAPQRQPMADVPTGFLAMTSVAGENIMRTTGIFQASIGQRGTATSGKQELAQQREGDVANSHYYDGLLRTMRRAGRVLVGSMPYYYDSERTTQILGEGNTKAETVTINQPNTQRKALKDGSVPDVLNNIAAGRFDITISSGPSYTTMREENAEFFANALSSAKDPAQAAIYGYQAMKNSDAPGADLATRMMETLLPPPAKAVLDEENGKQEDGPKVMTPKGPVSVEEASQIIAGLEQTVNQASEAVQAAEVSKQRTEEAKAHKELREQELEPQRIAAETAKTQAMIADAEARKAEAAAKLKQAEADLVRANAESACAPQKAAAELHTARATEAKAQNELRQPIPLPEDPEREKVEQAERDEKALSKIAQAVIDARPKYAELSIKAPSGMTYDVKATLR